MRLAYALNQALEERGLSQVDAGTVLGVTQPKVSALHNYKLAGFFVGELASLPSQQDTGCGNQTTGVSTVNSGDPFRRITALS